MKEGWTYKKLGEVGQVVTGNTPSTKDSENYDSNDYCFVKPSDICVDRISQIAETEFYISEKAFQKSRQLPKGSVLTTCIGIIGKVGILQKEATCNQQINAIIPSSIISSEYLALAIFSIRQKMELMANAPVVPIINKSDFSNFTIPVPPLAEQQRIVSELDLLQGIIDKQQAQLKELDTLAQSIFYDMFGDPVENEKGWEVKRLGDVCKFVNGDRGKNYPSVKDFIEEGFPFINAGHLLNGKVDFKEMNYISEERYNLLNAGKIQNGDILFCLRGSLGKYAKIDFDTKGAIASSLVIIRCKECINLDFVIADLNTPAIKSQIQKANNGSSQPNLSAKSVAGFSILLPPITLQQEFAEKIEKIERQKSAISQSIAETQKLFDYTMDKYFG